MASKSKWLKWQIGAAGAAVVYLVFGAVQDSPAFQAAVARHAAAAAGPAPVRTGQSNDGIVDDWNAARNDSGSAVPGGDGGGSADGISGDDTYGGANPGASGGSSGGFDFRSDAGVRGFHSRTGRS